MAATSAASASTSSSSDSAEQDALKALTFQRLHPKTYLERFLAEDVRPDGRDFDEWRDISLIVGSYVFLLHAYRLYEGEKERAYTQ